jgi:hypothetical protein
LALLCAALVPVQARAGTQRIALLVDAPVHGDTILLSHLFPPTAPTRIRDSARAVTLGSAPQIGQTRQFAQEAIANAIETAELPLSSFTIPQIVTVHRSGHALSREEVFAALQAVLAKRDPTELRVLRPQDLRYDSSVALSDNDAKLVVTQIQFDKAIDRARFRLQTKSATLAPPFYVTANLKPQESAINLVLAPLKPSQLNVSHDRFPHVKALVDPRRIALLHLHSKASDMLLAVRPLERGSLGQTIRVRLRESGKTLVARVAGNNSLDASF